MRTEIYVLEDEEGCIVLLLSLTCLKSYDITEYLAKGEFFSDEYSRDHDHT